MTYSRVYVEITNICNRSCSFCHGHRRVPRQMTEGEFTLLLDKLSGMTNYIYYHIMGEPTTHPSLPRFIELAAKQGYKSVVTTNGTLLGSVGDSLIRAGVYKINLSLHSFEDEDCEEFENYINTCLDLADRASEAGVLVILRLWNSGHDGGRNAKILSMLKEKFADGEWIDAKGGARIRHRLHLEYGERFEWPDMTAKDGGEQVFCYALSDHFGILCDGSVVPCCLDSEGTLTLGNAFEQDISEILSSRRAVEIRDGFKRRCAGEELCRKCGYARRFI